MRSVAQLVIAQAFAAKSAAQDDKIGYELRALVPPFENREGWGTHSRLRTHNSRLSNAGPNTSRAVHRLPRRLQGVW
ncbi:exported hypothetical protein [Candidatus Sulfotelmatobacter kueseliae]|uniref:Uncharacterized protein n=1 Tax=Candidatus Sulfotelmatobacter kueseliae TaxID=2042962 RepID=A0A2U3L0N3_9BACT|nr:exported hypothetical protein [Candidatus Sulfotelmatobacter kueseliae]